MDNRPPLLTFERDPERPEPGFALLAYPRRWFVGAAGACSCNFRHLHSVELSFGAPEDWFPEDEADIEATRRFYNIVAGLLSAGSQVDCVSQWVGTPPEAVTHIEIDLAAISREVFRFFEDHHFTFSHGGGSSPDGQVSRK